MDEAASYRQLQASGADACAVYHRMKRDGVSLIDSIRMLRIVFGLGLADAKEVTCQVDQGCGLAEYQGRLVPDLDVLLTAWDDMNSH